MKQISLHLSPHSEASKEFYIVGEDSVIQAGMWMARTRKREPAKFGRWNR
jgi:hypothetical protein